MRPVCIVTGASSGIGAETAVGVAKAGYDVALVARNVQRLNKTAARVRGTGAAARTYSADFAELAQVRRLADELLRDHPRIDVLVNNAGAAFAERAETVDGFEQTFAVNHLAPYLLTRLLLDRLVDSAPARVVVVASDAYKFSDVDPDDWNSKAGWSMQTYGRSKLCNLLFAQELARRYPQVAVTTVHPGFVSTSLGRDKRIAHYAVKLLRPFIRSPEKGARTSIALATGRLGAEGGARYYVSGKEKRLQPRALHEENARRLWDDSARMVGLDP